MKRTLLPILFVTLISTFIFGQQSNDIKQALALNVTYDNDNNVTVHWLPKEDATEYRVSYRVDIYSPHTFLDAVGPEVTSVLIDDDNIKGQAVEIRVQKFGGTNATGYIYAGNEYFQPTERKSLLILVEEGLRDSITAELELYREVLANELWSSDVVYVQKEDSPPSIKEIIKNKHFDVELDAVLLVGHVPVPYSYNNAIDGHNNHRGAWPADGYYGELDGNWTDATITDTTASRQENWNVPGDGKFDQIVFPSQVSVAIGRVDLSRLPKFSESEAELTRNYFQKNIAYRTGEIETFRRGLIDNNFNLAEGFAQGAIKSFSGWFPQDSIHYGVYADLKTKPYLWSYGAGGGNYQGASGIINTNQLVTDSIQTIFTTLFGSYFGDWDIENNLLRASIANGSTLTNAWSGRPIWHYHLLSMGKSFADVILMVQNNNGSYFSQFGSRFTHIALMGDPTLKMYYHKKVENLTHNFDGEYLNLSWSHDENVAGYNVYQVVGQEVVLLNDEFITDTNYSLLCPVENVEATYIVRPVLLESSPSGSYYNEGAGAGTVVEPIAYAETGLSVSVLTGSGNTLVMLVEADNQSLITIDYGDGTEVSGMSNEEYEYTYSEDGQYTVTVYATLGCRTDSMEVFMGVTSVDDESEIGWSVYPNPTAGSLQIEYPIVSPIKYQITTIDGAVIKEGVLTEPKSTIIMPEAEGIYLLRVGDQWKKVIRK